MIQSRLKSYTLSAGAATTLAVLNGAAADIIGSPSENNEIGRNAAATILFSIDGKRLNAINFTESLGGGSQFYATAGFYGGDFNFKIVGSGVTVDNALGFTGSEAVFRSYIYSFSGTSSGGDLPLGTNNLVAFSAVGTETHYGWISYSIAYSAPDGYDFTVHSWAYNDVAGEGIIAGQTTASGSSAVPGLGGLAALAIGAAGVRSRRQRTVA